MKEKNKQTWQETNVLFDYKFTKQFTKMKYRLKDAKNEPNIYYSLCTHKEYISFYSYIFLYSNVLCHQSEFNVSLFFFCSF